jgi:hypothetical protein
MPSLKGRLTFRGLPVTRHTLLTKPDRLDLRALFSHNNVRLCGVVGCALRLVVARNASTVQARVSYLPRLIGFGFTGPPGFTSRSSYRTRRSPDPSSSDIHRNCTWLLLLGGLAGH